MVFPQNIHIRTRRMSNRVALKSNAAVMVTLVLLLFCFFLAVPYASAYMPRWVARILFYGGVLGIMQFPIRKYTLREPERMEEFLSRGSEAFSKYMGIRNIDTTETIEVRGSRVPVFEFMNGSHAVYLKIDIGRSDVQTAKNTQEAFAAAFMVLGESNIGYSDFTFREVFSETREGQDMMERLNLVKDPKFRPFVTSIYKYAIDLADLNANVPEYYLMITTKTPFQRVELPRTLEKFLDELEKRRTSIRSMQFLNNEDVLKKLAKRFYGLSAIDISRSLVMDTMNEEFSSSLVQLYKVKKDGKVFTHPDVVDIKISATKLT